MARKYAKHRLKPTAFKPRGSIFEGLVWRVPNSRGDGYYSVELDDVGFECDCPGFTFRGSCKHSKQVLKQVEDAVDDRSPKYTWFMDL